MADRGSKKQSGQTRARTVCKLLPVRYMVTFSYMGHERIARNDSDYRCPYTVEPGLQPGAPPFHERDPRRMPNVVAGTASDDPSVKASTPSGQGGDTTNPPSDEVYRIMVVDNHGMRDEDGDLLGRGGSPDGDTTSKPASYNDLDWMPDVKPAVPFRIVVRKFVGTAQTDFDKPLKAVIEIKDPVEEFAQNDGNRRDFMERFLAEYNGPHVDPDVGDDNCPTTFEGLRGPAATRPGVKATDVLKRAPYRSKPVTDLPPSDASVNVQFSELSDATARDTNLAEFDLEEVDESGKKVGVADLAFLPYPAFGDNFRFLITLVEGTQDVRDTQENGHDVEVTDHLNRPIPKPRAYTTGRFIVWKRMRIRKVVLVNRTSPGDFNWGGMRTVYRKSFIDIVEPAAGDAGYFRLTADQWIEKLKEIFTSGADATALDALKTPPASLATLYGQNFFPPHLQNNKTRAELRSAIDSFVRKVTTLACEQHQPTALEPPDSPAGKAQGPDIAASGSDGFFVTLLRRLVDPATAPNNATAGNVRSLANLLGAAFGDRMFWFTNGQLHPSNTIELTTNTLSHEMGHAQYLRHGHTNGVIGGGGGGGDRGIWNGAAPLGGGAAPAPINFRFFSSQTNNQYRDHDQNDAYNCLMSYTPQRVSSIAPCAVCNLTLRFWDRVKIQSAAEYREEIMSGLEDAVIALVSNLVQTAGSSPSGTWTLREPSLQVGGGASRLPNVRVGNNIIVVAVSRQETYHSQSGPGTFGRINLSCLDTNAASLGLWSQNSTNGGRVTFAVVGGNRIRVTGASAGLVTIWFARDGVTAEVQVQVVP